MEETSILSALWPQLLARAAGKSVAEPTGLDAQGQALWQLYAPIADAPAGYAIGQLGQSLDGRVATAAGESHYINGRAAIAHLHRLRALADAVVVGIGTVLADDPRLTVRHAAGASPARVVIDPNGRLPLDCRLLNEDGVKVLVLQGDDRPRPSRVRALTLPMRGGHLDPRDILAALRGRGLRRVLVEGGARTVSRFLAAGALDRLHLCVAPLIIGSGPMGLALPPVDKLEDALRPAVAVHRLGEDLLFDCAFAGSR